MIEYSRYFNQEDHVWYNSSNIVYSKCYDTSNSMFKTLKIVFKGGRTYVYKDVDVKEYMLFKTAESNGEAFNKYIKKYGGVKIADTNMEELGKMQEMFKEEISENEKKKIGDITYEIKVDEKTGEFTVSLDNKVLFRGVEGNFSILNLLTSLGFRYVLQQVEELPKVSDEDDNVINTEKV